ncbi:MAG: type II toxin-antitoxin system HicA family toxin [Taibaiella sp.]|nr:type II toxin-antitoxin system HicA family toxin [Taibaiella sp.]
MKSSELIRLVKKAGWTEIRQSGSHKIFVHVNFKYSLPVPDHGSKEVATGTAISILKKAGIKP